MSVCLICDFPTKKILTLWCWVKARFMFSSVMSFCTGWSNTLFFLYQGRNQMGCIHKKMHIYIYIIYLLYIIYIYDILICHGNQMVCVCVSLNMCLEDSLNSPLTGILGRNFAEDQQPSTMVVFGRGRIPTAVGVSSCAGQFHLEFVVLLDELLVSPSWERVLFWCKEYNDIQVNYHRMT